MFEPTTAGLANYLASMIPLKEVMVKLTMQSVVMLLSTIENEIGGKNNWKYTENQKYIEYEILDFVTGFERRILMATLGTIIINSPKSLLNGILLKKLINSGKISI